MSDASPILSPVLRAAAALGALMAAAGIALSAYAAHAAGAAGQAALQSAALMALVHGAAVVALVPRVRNRWVGGGLAAMLLGVLLFSGTLVAAHAFDTPARLAPLGGTLLIAAWVLVAVGMARR